MNTIIQIEKSHDLRARSYSRSPWVERICAKETEADHGTPGVDLQGLICTKFMSTHAIPRLVPIKAFGRICIPLDGPALTLTWPHSSLMY